MIRIRLEAIEDLDLIPGSGNVFRDLNEPGADLKQAKAVLAASIIKSLDAQPLTMRAAAEGRALPRRISRGSVSLSQG